jgi:hypothetical protein
MAVLNLSAIAARPYMLGETLKHELCHLLLHENIPQADLPKWLDEGVCQWVTGSLGEVLIGVRDYGTATAELNRRPFPLRQISRSFPGDRQGILLAYEESRSFVDYISSRYGTRSLLAILEHLKDGRGLEAAFERSLSKSVETVEGDWREHVGRSLLWIVWVSQYMYELIFFFTALLALTAFLKIRRRRRRFAEEEDEEGPGDDSMDGSKQ